MDDPVSLVLYLVTALAGGMYPLGFIFGGCSACCQGCPDKCSRCSGINHFDPNWSSVCFDTFDMFTLESEIDSATKANVTPDGNNIVNRTINILTGLNCESLAVPGFFETLEITIQARFFERVFRSRDACECNICRYVQGLEMGVAGKIPSDSGFCTFQVRFDHDKCAADSAVATLVLTKDQLENCLEESSGGYLCEGLPDEVEVTLTYELDYECECGACCRGGVCSDNESQSYCEDNGFYSLDGQGVWQGVGTDCDPNPCT
jgi:hypothetical protein